MSAELDALPPALEKLLLGRVWHATSFDRYERIIEAEEIRPDAESVYGTAFCRQSGGVSLFDFRAPLTTIQQQSINWHGWLGPNFAQSNGVAVWFCIDPTGTVIEDAASLLHRWKETPAIQRADGSSYKPNIIPGVEACHVGPIPLACIEGVAVIRGDRMAAYDLVPNNETLERSVANRHIALLSLATASVQETG